MASDTTDNDTPDQAHSVGDAMQRFRRRSRTALDAKADGRSSRHGYGDLVSEQWQRFWLTSRWEKSAMLAGLALVVVGVAIVVRGLMSGGSSQPASVVLAATPPPRAAEPPTEVAPDPAATSTAAASVAPSVPTVAALPPNRSSCEEIQGTAYTSYAEREWFLANCQAAVASDAPAFVDTAADSPSNAPVEPAPAATADSSPDSTSALSAAEAISLASDWMTSEGELRYTVNEGSCSATPTGSGWAVSCQVLLVGCQSAICVSTRTACVSDADRVVVPAKLC